MLITVLISPLLLALLFSNDLSELIVMFDCDALGELIEVVFCLAVSNELILNGGLINVNIMIINLIYDFN